MTTLNLKPQTRRNNQIVKTFLATEKAKAKGKEVQFPYIELANKYGISKQRVVQIIKRSIE